MTSMHDDQTGVKCDIFNNEGVQIDSVTSTHGIEQLICEPTHMLCNSALCIYLILQTNRT